MIPVRTLAKKNMGDLMRHFRGMAIAAEQIPCRFGDTRVFVC